MKSGQIFWGLFFLTIGTTFLLVRNDLICLDWYFLLDLWPVLLILWGLTIITKETKVKPLVVALFGILIGLIVFGTIHSFFTSDDCYEYDFDGFGQNTYTEEYDSTSKYANLELSAGAGSFTITESTPLLVKGTTSGSLAKYYFNTTKRRNKAWVDIEQTGRSINIFGSNFRNRLNIELNENPVWDIDLNLGASTSFLDLSDFKVSNLSLNTGASKTKIKLGNKYDEVKVDVDMGAATLIFIIPKESGCKIIGDMVLVARDIEGFRKRNSDNYVTSNYGSADSKILLDINSGVSYLKVIRR
ncbi:hypothetical protein ACFLS9_04655 [Bacteroidota bacterium]